MIGMPFMAQMKIATLVNSMPKKLAVTPRVRSIPILLIAVEKDRVAKVHDTRPTQNTKIGDISFLLLQAVAWVSFFFRPDLRCFFWPFLGFGRE